MFDDLIKANTTDDNKIANADTTHDGEGKNPPELFTKDSKTEVIPYFGDETYKNEKLQLLNKFKNTSAHKKNSFTTLNEGIKQASYIAILFAEADESLYEKELKHQEDLLANAKQGVKDNRGTYNEDVKKFRVERASIKKKLRKLKSQKNLRGHNVEWSSVVIQNKNGKYQAVGATPGGKRRPAGDTQPADDIYGADLVRSGYKNLNSELAHIHSHPRFGDRAQVAIPKDMSNSGLHPSDDDKKVPGVQAMVNQRGKIVKYGVGKNSIELTPGIDRKRLKKGEFGAMTAIKEGDNKNNWQNDLDEISGVLDSIDRKKLQDYQEKIE